MPHAQRNPNPHFPHLFEPLTVGARTLRNRIVMGSMHTRLDAEPDATARKAAFYGERAAGGVAMVITGGIAPNAAGRMEEDAAVLDSEREFDDHRATVRAIQTGGALAIMQILHAGRYAKIERPVGPSAIASPINKRTIHALTDAEVEQTIDDYARCAALAQRAGYDGVEIMASEGYLITEFLALRTNNRTDRWGGPLEARLRFPTEIVRRVRAATGADFVIVYRISALDLVEDGLTADEIAIVARAVQAAGADMLDTGIGWHEARVPTIAYMVPRAAWRDATARLKAAVTIPVAATNRINTPEVAEELIASGVADLVSLARPLLADSAFAAKAETGRADEINTCVGCNQACLDYIFRRKVASCLVNPRAGHELAWSPASRSATPKRIAVIGAGAAGLACAVTAFERGHDVTLYEAEQRIGGQLNLAAAVPGKEFAETLRYFRTRLARSTIRVQLGVRASVEALVRGAFDAVVIASGVRPRVPAIPGIESPSVIRYDELLDGRRVAGHAVAIIGAGGIGFDVAEYLSQEANSRAAFLAEWSVDPSGATPGGLLPPTKPERTRRITILQRKPDTPGKTLGLTTGWTIRAELARRGVAILTGVSYQRIDATGLHILHDGQPRLVEADSIVVCAGQESVTELAQPLADRGVRVEVIGGAKLAAELDAMRAISEGMAVARHL